MKLKLAVIAFAILFLGPLVKADSIWTFDGELTDPGTWHEGFSFPDCNCALDGVMVFDDSFKVLAYSWTDGTHTLNQNNSTMVFMNNPQTQMLLGGAPGPYPPLITWVVSITGVDDYLHTNYDGLGASSLNVSLHNEEIFGWGQPNLGAPGAWTEVVSTPEPSSLLLLGLTGDAGYEGYQPFKAGKWPLG